MTNEEIRIKVAEAMGWNLCPAEIAGPAARLFNGDVWYRHAESHTIATTDQLPNYPESLDACAEFEKTLTWEEQEVFKVRLSRITADDFYEARTHWSPHTHHATARQRCLAYLKTKGLIP